MELHVLRRRARDFTSAARNGLDATLYWPGTGWIRPDELVLRKLLPMAAEGLARWGWHPRCATATCR